MCISVRLLLVCIVLTALTQHAGAQQAGTAPQATPVSTGARPASNAVAATVNGQPILERAVLRGLDRVPPTKHAEARPEIIDYLIENLLIDQYLLQINIAVDKKEVDARVDQIRAEIDKEKKTFAEVMQQLKLTEEELRSHIAADLRWDKYASQQATDKVLREFFAANREMFDGSMVHARHILLTPAGDENARAQARAQLAQFKQQIEQQVAAGLAKLPANTDNLGREQSRCKLINDAFAALAKDKSQCPSKERGGDIGEFPRGGSMVEPFARAAFALKAYQMSDVVATQFGFHLILALEKRAGKDVKYDEVKDEVKDVYAARLRESITPPLRQRAKIEIKPAPRS